jgi:glucan phosphoethanolaminetransferase (alkaline phosphatase superfamily)
MLIHTPTMFLVIVTTSFTLALAIAWISYRKNNSLFNPLFMWSLALALHGGAYLLFSLRGYINDAVSIVVGNSFLSAGFALFGEAIYRFHDEQPNRLTLWAPVVFIAISLACCWITNKLVWLSAPWSLLYKVQPYWHSP